MDIYKIDAGYFNADGGACFGVVPKKVWKKRYPCDAANFCKLTMRCLLIDTGTRRLLIDTGAGNKQTDYLKFYGIKDMVDFEASLHSIGYSCDDITDVILTHLHFDHCGGCTKYLDQETVGLTFPNALYWVASSQWHNFMSPNVREGDAYFMENMWPVKEAGRLQLVDEPVTICPGVKLKLFDGHTVGQLVVYIELGAKTFVYVGDVIPTAANVPLAWVSAYDTYPITSMLDKQMVMDEAIENEQILILEHDAYVEACTVMKVNEKYKVKTTGTIEKYKSGNW